MNWLGITLDVFVILLGTALIVRLALAERRMKQGQR